MAVIIREKKIIEGKEYIVKVYKTYAGKLLTQKEKVKAEKLDDFLSSRMKEINHEIENSGLLKSKGRKGKVLRLWYEVGKRLKFIEDTSLIRADERGFVWRAIYDHADKLAPGPLSERAKSQPERSHFSYCYKISQFPLEFVESAGNWASWSEFFDRKETKNDLRIIEWIGEKAKEHDIRGERNWLRSIAKLIHYEFDEKDTSVFSREELFKHLDDILKRMNKQKRN